MPAKISFRDRLPGANGVQNRLVEKPVFPDNLLKSGPLEAMGDRGVGPARRSFAYADRFGVGRKRLRDDKEIKLGICLTTGGPIGRYQFSPYFFRET